MAEGDMIQRNTDPWTKDTIAYPVQQVSVPRTQRLDPGEGIPLPGLGVKDLNLEDLPLLRCQHHLVHLHLPILQQWLIACPPIINGALPLSDQRQGIYHQSLMQIPLSGKPDLKGFQISPRDFSWRSAASL